MIAYRSAINELGPGRVISMTTGRSVTRRGLAKLSTLEKLPVGVAYPASPVERGKIIEAWLNRALDPHALFKMTKPDRLR